MADPQAIALMLIHGEHSYQPLGSVFRRNQIRIGHFQHFIAHKIVGVNSFFSRKPGNFSLWRITPQGGAIRSGRRWDKSLLGRLEAAPERSARSRRAQLQSPLSGAERTLARVATLITGRAGFLSHGCTP